MIPFCVWDQFVNHVCQNKHTMCHQGIRPSGNHCNQNRHTMWHQWIGPFVIQNKHGMWRMGIGPCIVGHLVGSYMACGI